MVKHNRGAVTFIDVFVLSEVVGAALTTVAAIDVKAMAKASLKLNQDTILCQESIKKELIRAQELNWGRKSEGLISIYEQLLD